MTTFFIPRTSPPSNKNKYYIKTTFGGYNKCIVIDRQTGSVLPNCTGYAWGRFCECQENVTNCNLSRGNAEVWYGNTSDGYERGQTPKLASVICWHSTQSGGHVAIVEEIKSNGDIVTSNSAYNGTRFYMRTLSPPNYYMGSAYTFQGFIYNPTEFEKSGVNTHERKYKWVLFSKNVRKRRNRN